MTCRYWESWGHCPDGNSTKENKDKEIRKIGRFSTCNWRFTNTLPMLSKHMYSLPTSLTEGVGIQLSNLRPESGGRAAHREHIDVLLLVVDCPLSTLFGSFSHNFSASFFWSAEQCWGFVWYCTCLHWRHGPCHSFLFVIIISFYLCNIFQVHNDLQYHEQKHFAYSVYLHNIST